MKARIKRATAQTIHQIWAGGAPNKAVLAALRNSNSILNRNATVIWPLLISNLEKKDLSRNGEPTYAEKAVYAALRCYAIYQQGNDEQCVYAPTDYQNGEYNDLFTALAALRRDTAIQEALDRRVQVVLGNSNADSIINALYHLVAILKSKEAQRKIDFAQLGQELYYIQLNRESARQVCLRWGQQYYRIDDQKQSKKEK